MAPPGRTITQQQSSGSTAPPPAWASGTSVGRLVLGEVLGQGGAGRVYVARDAALDRDVAVKVLHTSAAARPDALREAQLMARIRHPNVVTVHDVGVHEDSLFITMELVDGGTAAQLMADGPPALSVTLPILLQTARGLHALHQRGVLHRDVKPANILLMRDGRALLSDLGLASTGLAGPGAELTSVGTPGFMAPELTRGGTRSIQSDIFSLSVTMHQLATGALPFTAEGLDATVWKEAARHVPRRVPRWLWRLIWRGLDPDPAGRPSSAEAIALEIERHQRRGLAAPLAAGLTVLLVTGILVGMQDHQRQHACDALGTPWDVLWTPQAAQAVQGAEALARVRGFGEAWLRVRTEACRASLVLKLHPEAQWLAQDRCLDARLSDVRALLEVARERTLPPEKISDAVARLQPPQDCSQILASGRYAAAPPGEGVQKLLSTARALAGAGAADEAVAMGRQAVTAAAAVGAHGAASEAHLLLADTLHDQEQWTQAGIHARQALASAARIPEHTLLAHAAVYLAFQAVVVSRHREAEDWLAASDAFLGQDTPPLRLRLERVFCEGELWRQAGQAQRAVDVLETARPLLARPEALTLRHTLLSSLANALSLLGRNDDARVVSLEGLAAAEELYGHTHPALLATLQSIAAVEMAQNHLDSLDRYLLHMDDIAAAHPETRAEVLLLRMRAADARLDSDAVLELVHQVRNEVAARANMRGHEAPSDVCLMGGVEASALLRKRRCPDALASARINVDVCAAAHGQGHVLARSMVLLARAQRRCGTIAEAARAVRDLQAMLAEKPDISLRLSAPAQSVAGGVALDEGHHAAAVELLQSAAAAPDAVTRRADWWAELEIDLAHALWADPARRKPALEYAESALRRTATVPSLQDLHTEAAAFLAARRGDPP